MLALAREKRVYDALRKAELTQYLDEHDRAFDLIVSADTLVYFGDLRRLLAAAARALRPNGLFVFTLEDGGGGDAAPYHLERHGRYSHRRSAVAQWLAAAGLDPEIRQADLRMESGAPVAGLVVRARRSAAAER
jgi:predicted TPR repeat methyltransferase